MRLPILLGDDPQLRKKAAAVTTEEFAQDSFQAAIDDLFETMQVADGIGLAAPQVGIAKQIVIVTVGNTPLCLINPVITQRSKEIRLGEEGCLSFPGLFGKVARSVSIEVEFLDRHGKKQQLNVKHLDARVIQHEMDHLVGILLPDRLKEKVKAPEEAYAGRSL
jgi:peptide deformylase